MDQEQMTDVLKNGVFPHLFIEAERVRWRMSDIPWQAIDQNLVTPGWRALIREVVFGELTTYNATERFFKEFAEDVDFTQWLSVWLYEETKHPFVFMRWLHEFGETFTSPSVLKGRETYPFMNSKIATLSTNIFSEVMASTLYMTLSVQAREPVLKSICKKVAADEARHASHFYTFAKKRIDASDDRERAVKDAVNVLHFWLETDLITHPANLFVQRLTAVELTEAVAPEIWNDTVKRAQARMVKMCSALVGRQL